MAWENIITGYRLRRFDMKDVIPADAKFIAVIRDGFELGGQLHMHRSFVYQVPIYKKKNIKRK